MSKDKKYEVAVDEKLVPDKVINFRELMARAMEEEPSAFKSAKATAKFNTVMVKPLTTRANAAAGKRAEAQARRFLKQKTGRKIGDWTSERDWQAFITMIVELLKELLPMFAAC